jgi:hypothetical protein
MKPKGGGQINMGNPRLAFIIFKGFCDSHPLNILRLVICFFYWILKLKRPKFQWPFKLEPGKVKIFYKNWLPVAELVSASCCGTVTMKSIHPRGFNFLMGPEKDKLNIRRI